MRGNLCRLPSAVNVMLNSLRLENPENSGKPEDAFRDARALIVMQYVHGLQIGTLRSDNGDGNGNVRSLGRAGLRPVGVPAKIEITNFTSENVDDGH